MFPSFQDLKRAVVKLLQQFMTAASGRAPQRIIFMRDGISEGQFPQVPPAASSPACMELGPQLCMQWSLHGP